MSKSKKPQKRLGRGLEALLGSRNTYESIRPASTEQDASLATGLIQASLDAIQPNRWQPRQDFDQETLQNLADSIKQSGLMQPVLLRTTAQKGHYELVAGERRWRAAGLAGLKSIPAMLKKVSDKDMATLALVENLQREDLNSLEQAQALHGLVSEFGLTHEQAAQYIGQSRSAVSNLLRLLELSNRGQELLREGKLQMGHARAILTLPSAEQTRCAELIAREQWSVRVTEQWVKRTTSTPTRQQTAPKNSSSNANTRKLERALADHLGAPVEIRQKSTQKGTIVVHYGGNEELAGVIERIGLKTP